MTQVNIHTAKTTLFGLIQKAKCGEEVIIARRGKPRKAQDYFSNRL